MKQSNGQKKKPTRIVFDTNVLISSFIYGGSLKPISDLIEKEVITPCFIETTFLELQRVIHYSKFRNAFGKLSLLPEDVVYGLADKSIILPDPLEVTHVAEDTSDDFILASALEAKAFYIITGDKFLQNLKFFHDIPILTPAQFLALIQKRK